MPDETALAPAQSAPPSLTVLDLLGIPAEQVKDFPVDVIERMFALYQQNQKIENHRSYAAAFLAVQAEMQPVVKRGRNEGASGSLYARAEDVKDMLDPVLVRHGFATSFSSKPSELHDGWTCYILKVLHVDGHQEEFYFDAPLDDAGLRGQVNKTKIQGQAASFTFAKRQLLISAFNVTLIGPDLDGQQTTAIIDAAQKKQLEELLELTHVPLDKFLEYYDARSLESFPLRNFKSGKATLQKRLKEQEGRA